MARLVFYHHPQAENFSLKFSSTSVTEIRSQREQSDEPTKLIGYPFEKPVYVRYEGDSEIDSAQEVDFDQEWLSGQIRDLSRGGQVVAFRLVELLEAAVFVREEDEFRLYKELSPSRSSRHSITYPGEEHSRMSLGN